jgi:hypothetical protein
MAGLALLIALVALIVAVLAYRRTPGPKESETQMDTLRQKTADVLAKMEKSLRKDEKDNIVEPPQG